MWRLWHKLFGWHYVNISWRRSYGGTDYHQVRRVYTDGDGRPYTHHHDDMVYLSGDPSAASYEINPLTFPRAALDMNAKPADVIVLPRRNSAAK